MATAYSTLLGLALPVQGELSGTWGDVVNNYITNYLDASVAGMQILSTDADVTLTKTTNAALGATSSQYAIINCTGARTAQRTITAPAASKTYTIINATTGGFAVKLVGAGPTTGITILAGEKCTVAWNGSDFVKTGLQDGAGSFTTLNASAAISAFSTSAAVLDFNPGTNSTRFWAFGSAGVMGNMSWRLSQGGGTGTYVAMALDTTGLAVTGALSATGDIATENATYLKTKTSGGTSVRMMGINGSNTAYVGPIDTATGLTTAIYGGASSITVHDFYTGGSLRGEFNNTGLAVTGALSATTTISAGTNVYSTGGTDTQGFYLTSGTAPGSNHRMALIRKDSLGAGGALLSAYGPVGIEVNATSGTVGSGTLAATFDTSGNLGLGVTPSAWASNYKAIDHYVYGAVFGGSDGATGLAGNAYYNGTNWIYKTSNTATKYEYGPNYGAHIWFVASAGTAGAVATFTQAMTLTGGQDLGVGETSPNARFEVVKDVTYSSIDTFPQMAIKATTGTNGKRLNLAVDSTNNIAFIQALNRGTGEMNLVLQRYGGSLLVGTTTPDGFVTVSAPANTGYGSFDAVTSGYASLNLKNAGTTYAYIGSANAFITGGTASDLGVRSQNAITFATGGTTERMRLDASGNLIMATGAIQEHKSSIGASDINLSTGNYFSKTISGTTTLTVSNTPASGTVASFILDLTNGGSATVNWWANVKWAGGTAPTLTAAGRDVLGFFTYDAGSTWTGLVLGKDVK